jgi:hypothetical protein
MAKVVLTDARVTVNGVNLSDHCSSVTVETSKDEVDVTSFGAAFKTILAGLGDATITLSVFQDFAAGSVHATVWPLYTAGTTFPVTVRPTSAAESATNPTMTMTGIILSYNPLAGGVGEASSTDITIRNAANTGIVVTP